MMSNSNDETSTIEAIHRKEKKELQAHIQALKKAAKNDKTKKKELTAEIARLESELEARHKQELQATSTNIDELTKVQNGVEAKVKISKAQKRRDKKQQQEKEREEEIKAQEKENRIGPRNVEIQAIASSLKGNNLEIFPIPSDGDCLYKAIIHQMMITREISLSVDKLRKTVADYIKSNKDEFIPFMSNPDTSEMLTDIEFDEYCNKIENTKVWGGQLEIRALSNCLRSPITVIQATGPNLIEQGIEFGGLPLIITYHRHMYSLGEHYNSTVPVQNLKKDN